MRDPSLPVSVQSRSSTWPRNRQRDAETFAFVRHDDARFSSAKEPAQMQDALALPRPENFVRVSAFVSGREVDAFHRSNRDRSPRLFSGCSYSVDRQRLGDRGAPTDMRLSSEHTDPERHLRLRARFFISAEDNPRSDTHPSMTTSPLERNDTAARPFSIVVLARAAPPSPPTRPSVSLLLDFEISLLDLRGGTPRLGRTSASLTP